MLKIMIAVDGSDVSIEAVRQGIKLLKNGLDAHFVIAHVQKEATLLELATVWELKNKRFLDQGKPIVLAGAFWRPLVDLVAGDDPACVKAVAFAETPGEVAEWIGRGLRS